MVKSETLQGLLLRARESASDGVRLVDAGERERFLSWEELAARAAAAAGGLVAKGVGPGDRVALVHPTGEEFLELFFGALFAGAVPVPLYPPVRLGRLEEYHRRTAAMLAAVEAAIVVVDRRLAPLVAGAIAPPAATPPRLGWATRAELPPGAASTSEGRPDDLALVQFSSGTLVDPKPVALEQRAVLAQVSALSALFPDRPELRQSCLSWLPLYHDMGLIGCLFSALARAATITLLPPELFVARPALWLRALSRTRASVSVAPNFAYDLASVRIRDEELEGCDLSSWKVALCGAEAVSAATLRRFAERFAPYGFDSRALTPVYGLAEASLAVTFSELGRPFRAVRIDRDRLAREGIAMPVPPEATPPDAASHDAGDRREPYLQINTTELVSVGRPLSGFAVELRDPEGRSDEPLESGRVGRIFVSGPSLFREYLNQPLQTALVLRKGWLDTGDLGFLHEGELYLVGRAKDVLVVRGANHAPADVERAVDAVAGLRRGCAVAVSHAVDGAPTERLLLFVERRRGSRAKAGESSETGAIVARCRQAVLAAPGLALDEVHVLAPGTLPRTSSGKLRRSETLRRHLAGELSAPASASWWRVGLELVRGRRILRELTRARARSLAFEAVDAGAGHSNPPGGR